MWLVHIFTCVRFKLQDCNTPVKRKSGLRIPGTSPDLFDADDLNMFPDPLRGKIDPPAIPALFDLLLDHLLTIDLELGLVVYTNRRRQKFKVRFLFFYHTIHQRFNNYKLTI